jgi:hypothetical protein
MLAAVAALVASVVFASPTAVGPEVFHSEEPFAERPDLVQGAWLEFPGPGGEQVYRVEEDGRVKRVGLPPKLRGEELSIYPLQNGWTVAVARYLPREPPGQECCRPDEEPQGRGGCCAEWVLAQHGPHGRWTRVQPLPDSTGTRTWVSEPVESHGRLEIGWGDEYGHRVRVASLPLGGGLAHEVRIFGPLLRSGLREPTVSAEGGSLYISEFASPHASYIVERRISDDGRLGPVRLLISPLLKEQGSSFFGPHGSELYLYSAGAFELLVAHRAASATSFEPARLILPRVAGSPEELAAQAFNGRLLLPVEEEARHGEPERIASVTVSPAGIPGRQHAIEDLPGSSSRNFEGAVGDAGEWLVASTSWEGGPLWLHPYSPRCGYREQRIPLATVLTSHERPLLRIVEGRRGVFHLAWLDQENRVQTTSVLVTCSG